MSRRMIGNRFSNFRNDRRNYDLREQYRLSLCANNVIDDRLRTLSMVNVFIYAFTMSGDRGSKARCPCF